MMCYDIAHQIRWAKHTFSGRCDFTPMVCAHLVGIAHHSFYSAGVAGASRSLRRAYVAPIELSSIGTFFSVLNSNCSEVECYSLKYTLIESASGMNTSRRPYGVAIA